MTTSQRDVCFAPKSGPDSIDALFRLEPANRPSCNQSEQQKRNRWPNQENRYCEEVTRTLKSGPYPINNQIDHPPHNPCGGQQQPDAQQSAPPIQLRNFVCLLVGFSTRNSKALHRDLPMSSVYLLAAGSSSSFGSGVSYVRSRRLFCSACKARRR